MKWESTSICLVHSWNARLLAMKVATLLPQYIGIGNWANVLVYVSKKQIHNNLQAVWTIAHLHWTEK